MEVCRLITVYERVVQVSVPSKCRNVSLHHALLGSRGHSDQLKFSKPVECSQGGGCCYRVIWRCRGVVISSVNYQTKRSSAVFQKWQTLSADMLSICYFSWKHRQLLRQTCNAGCINMTAEDNLTCVWFSLTHTAFWDATSIINIRMIK